MLSRLMYWIRHYFGFSRTEIRGFVILLFLMIIMLVAPQLYKSFYQTPSLHLVRDQKTLDSLVKRLEETFVVTQPVTEKKTPKTLRPAIFDPNKASEKDLLALGLAPYLAQRIIKYRQSGGRFVIKSDLKKIYGLPDTTYQALHPYIDLPAHIGRKEKKDYSDKQLSYKMQPFDINLADTAQLKNIRGIGPVLAARIIKYRDLLGGFVSTDQFYEVYGLSQEVIERLQEVTFVANSFMPKKLNINTFDMENLKKHPYISYQLARAVKNYIREHGMVKDTSDLKNIYVVSDSLFVKLTPYIAF